MSSAGSEHEHKQRRPCELAGRSDGYERRPPEATALYQSIAQHWPGFVERLD